MVETSKLNIYIVWTSNSLEVKTLSIVSVITLLSWALFWNCYGRWTPENELGILEYFSVLLDNLFWCNDDTDI